MAEQKTLQDAATEKMVQVPVLVNSIASKKDGSMKLTLETREVSPEEATKIFELRNSEAWMFLAASQITEVEIPAEKPDPAMGKKTPGQRLRNTLYVLWQQKGSQGNFEQYYNAQMENMIEQVKENLQ